MARGDHGTNPRGAHHFPDADRCDVGLALVHPAAHGRIERDVLHLDDELAVPGFLDSYGIEPPVAGGGQADRPGGEMVAAIHAVHGWLQSYGPRRSYVS